MVHDSQTIDEKLIEENVHRFFNRELSWLAFNRRVLEEAKNPDYPLLERLRFVSISSSNLDEFYTVRVAGLKGMMSAGVTTKSADQLSPDKQLELIIPAIRKLTMDQQASFATIVMDLRSKGIIILDFEELSGSETSWLEEFFLDEVFPILTPLAVDPAHPFPFLTNGSSCIALKLKRIGGDIEMEGLIPMPNQLDRFVKLPGESNRYICLESVVAQFISQMFPDFEVMGQGLFRLLRDSELEVDDEAGDLMLSFETALRRRQRGGVIQVVVDEKMPIDLQQFVMSKLECGPQDVIQVKFVGLHDVSQVIEAARNDLLWEPFNARFPERIRDFGGDCFAAIRTKDIIVHHPYESFDVVVQFLRQAAIDPAVVAIKQTLYRTSKNSPIVSALIEAAEAGKSVTAMIELKARFDEAANINFARDLERAGVQVVYGFLDLKTHAKVSLVVRRENQNLRNYAHFGTGNYHPITAKTYTDLSFFTSDAAMCRDAARIFNYMTGYAKPLEMEKIFISPLSLRQKLTTLIEKEIEFAVAGCPATIWAKMNSLVDPDIIDLLYKASAAGVSIELVVRGICCLRPNVKGLSENINVRSIIGRFLEHSRIVCFGNGLTLPSENAKIYISSADWMYRNLDRRLEHFVPIENRTVRRQVLNEIMVANLRDNTNTWKLHSDGSYTRIADVDEPFSAHQYFMTNPSLSGMGSALEKMSGKNLISLNVDKTKESGASKEND
ncbi:MAG: RNA degradosome polyphosphate kinase [Rhodospirillaceae bacterium]|nr:RNA degradosome polyphosphate kinase [Rhodospirillaceae bacterium]|tara:strand:+ start:444 stop:2621 length:2178 start_codon:yes stop_codon:yes gene_type:complete